MSAPRVLFLADQFDDVPRGSTERHPGGAERTDAAALEVAPWPLTTARAPGFDEGRLADFELVIVGNLEHGTPRLRRALVRHGRYVTFEHDYRACRWRGDPSRFRGASHRWARRCDCCVPDQLELLEAARATVFLTHRQLEAYQQNPHVQCSRPLVLGTSLFDKAFFARVRRLGSSPPPRSEETLVLRSAALYKGTAQALAWCQEQGIRPRVEGNLHPQAILDCFQSVRRFVYLPITMEPAGRVVIEARFLGCEVVTNGNSGVTGESWWHLPDDLALRFLEDAPARFWRLVSAAAELPAPERAGLGAAAAQAALALSSRWLATGVRRARRRAQEVDWTRPPPGAGPGTLTERAEA